MARYVASGSIVGKTCPFCQTPVKPGTLVEVCDHCGITHHVECLLENQGKCTTFGCANAQIKQAAPYHNESPAQHQNEPLTYQVPIPEAQPVNAQNSLVKLIIGLIVAIGIGFFLVQNGITDGGTSSSAPAAKYPGAPPPSYAPANSPAANASPYTPPPPMPRSIITGNEVILRANHTIASNEVAYLNRGDRVDVVDRWTTKDSNEGILSKGNLTLTHNGKQVVLQQGQAVAIVRETSQNYVILIKVAGQWLEKKAEKDMITRIYGQSWLQVRMQNGRLGWVLSKFVQEN